jgi:hypothetical protein
VSKKAVQSLKYTDFSVTQDALKELWRLAFPNRQLPPLESELWKEMGWQNSDPATDFRFSLLVNSDGVYTT